MSEPKHYPRPNEAHNYEWVRAEDFTEPTAHLHPVLNYTKWNELRLAMYDLPFSISFRQKILGTKWVSEWDGEWYYHFRWGVHITEKDGNRFVMVHDQTRKLIDIEWAELHYDPANQAAVIAALAKLSIPYELSENGLKVFGHIDDTGRLTFGKS